MMDAKQLLEEARRTPAHGKAGGGLSQYVDTIKELRGAKGMSWAKIAKWFGARGIKYSVPHFCYTLKSHERRKSANGRH
jgi:hypothetical protein